MTTKTKAYHAKVFVWKEGKQKTVKMKGVTVFAKNPTNAHRLIMEQLWSGGYLLRRFIQLYRV